MIFYRTWTTPACVLMALHRVKFPDPKRWSCRAPRIQWLLSIRTLRRLGRFRPRPTTRHFLCNIPFADPNAMIDPSTADVTGTCAPSAWAADGWPADHRQWQRGLKFLLQDQCEDGSWFGRWGVNYVNGTSGVLRALETVSLTAKEYCQVQYVGFALCKRPTEASVNRCAVSRAATKGLGKQHGFTDRLGFDRLACWLGHQRSCHSESRSLPRRAQTTMVLERDRIHARFPLRFLL